MAYISSSRAVTLDTRGIAARQLNVSWFNPTTGDSQILREGMHNLGSFVLEKPPDDLDGVVVLAGLFGMVNKPN